MPTIRPERAVASLAILTGWLWMVVDGGMGEEIAGEEILQPQKVLGRVRVWVLTLGRKVDCPIVGKERPIESQLYLPCPEVLTPLPPAQAMTLTRRL